MGTPETTTFALRRSMVRDCSSRPGVGRFVAFRVVPAPVDQLRRGCGESVEDRRREARYASHACKVWEPEAPPRNRAERR
jgi:hypothetical protein